MKDTLVELITFYLGEENVKYNDGGMCSFNIHIINQQITCLILMIFYISCLSSLHCLIWKYFKKNQLEDSYQQYRSKLIIFYVSSIFTFPQMIISIVNPFLSVKKENGVFFGLFMFDFIAYNMFLLISSLFYCVNKNSLITIKNKCCCKKIIPSADETLIQISLLTQTTSNF